jgi:hypothetical protein
LIQIGTDEIGKVSKETKNDIIDFNDEKERAEVLNKISEVCKKNLDSDSDCGVDVLYDDEYEFLLVASTRDFQTMKREIQKYHFANPSSPALRSMEVEGNLDLPFHRPD